jgi:hypothetical protein
MAETCLPDDRDALQRSLAVAIAALRHEVMDRKAERDEMRREMAALRGEVQAIAQQPLRTMFEHAGQASRAVGRLEAQARILAHGDEAMYELAGQMTAHGAAQHILGMADDD